MTETQWHKSSYSNASGGNCVEVGTTWHKSSFSNESGGNCLEVGAAWHKSRHSSRGMDNCVECRAQDHRVLVRDTQHPHLGHLDIPTAEWHAFLSALHHGELD